MSWIDIGASRSRPDALRLHVDRRPREPVVVSATDADRNHQDCDYCRIGCNHCDRLGIQHNGLGSFSRFIIDFGIRLSSSGSFADTDLTHSKVAAHP